MIAKLKCLISGHKRGKPAPDVTCPPNAKAYRCPRCQATWTRKVKAA